MIGNILLITSILVNVLSGVTTGIDKKIETYYYHERYTSKLNKWRRNSDIGYWSMLCVLVACLLVLILGFDIISYVSAMISTQAFLFFIIIFVGFFSVRYGTYSFVRNYFAWEHIYKVPDGGFWDRLLGKKWVGVYGVVKVLVLMFGMYLFQHLL